MDWLAFTPKTLALISVALTGIPFLITLVLFAVSKNAANSNPAYYSILVFPITILGLVVSGIWYLFTD